jgi:hypothetical protein
MDATELVFPVICFNQGIFEVKEDFYKLSTCSKYALKRGWYKSLLIIDSVGESIRVKSARKLHGIGRFWGYSIFLNQRIKVELTYDGEPFQITVEDLRKHVLDSLNTWEGWQEQMNFEEWKASFEKASTIAEIIRLAGS